MKTLSKKPAPKIILAIILFFSIFLSQNLFAQAAPAILIKNQNSRKHTSLKMSDLKINIKVVGNIATTTMEMTFYNGLNRVLEGQFYFPLGEGQTVSRFAMDVNGKLREGVVVEKAKGRQVFESVVRRQIDPGLLEWTKGNSFKARIYPIPAKGHKKLLVAYENEIKDTADGFVYLLPLAFKKKVDNFSLKVEVFKQEIKPRPAQGNKLINVFFKKWNEAFIADMRKKDYRPNKQLAFLLPKAPTYRKILIEKDKKKTGGTYFYLHLNPKIIHGKKKLPKKICLLWDASGSAAQKNIKKELALLGSYFRKIRNLEVELVLFRNAPSKKKERFKIRKGNWKKLRRRLYSISYDGGTQLGSLNLDKYRCDEFILSSDGISNFGNPDIKLSKTPVVVINSVLTAQHSYLNYVARKTGGVYLNLTRITRNEAMRSLLNQPYSFLRASYSDKFIAETYPAISTVVHKDFALSGKLLKQKATITLHFGIGGKVKYSQMIYLDAAKHLSKSGLVKRIWAQKKVAHLDMQFKKNKESIIELGKKFSIVTRNTSLIVLDRLEDYVENRIVPPEEMQKEYFAIIENKKMEKNKEERDHIEQVITKFKTLQEWWNTKFSLGKPPVKKPEKKKSGSFRSAPTANGDHSDNGDTGVEESDESSIEGASGMADMGAIRGRDAASGERRRSSPKKKEKASAPKGSFITLKKWDPKTPYLAKLKKTRSSRLYPAYLKLKKKYANSSAFYLDVADYFAEKKKKDLALRILSNIAEMELENPQLLRILAHRLAQLKHYKLAISVFEEVRDMREEEPQSFRDLGLVYAEDKQYQNAVNMLYEVVRKKWDPRFPDIELIALHEMNSIIARAPQLNLRRIDRRLIKNLDVDIRVVLNWDADNTDMDLWVFDPNKEKCYYSHNRTFVGGMMSKDFTRGYGPEIYMLKKAKSGKYAIDVNYYGNSQQVLAGTTTIQIQLFLNYGRKNQVKKEITLRLKDKKEVVKVGGFDIKVRKGKVGF
ncbi:MAG: DUF2135 domain-containing protein [bacterium]|nr:DUF2135 domain-containing protein [bacterium]